MVTSRLESIVEQYEKSLTALKQSIHVDKLSEDEWSLKLLEVLVRRHTVQVSINKNIPVSSNLLSRIHKADKDLREVAKSIKLEEQLTEWRAILNAPAEHWWSFFEGHKPISKRDRFNPVWSFVSLLFLGCSASYATDIITRLLSGGPDIQGTLLIILQSFLALIAGGTLTKTGQEFLETTFKGLKQFKSWWHEIGAVLSALLLMFLFFFHLNLPALAAHYNRQGLQDYKDKKYMSSEDNFNRALKLKPEYPEARYNLAQVYEDLQDSRASAEYQLAVKGGYYKAYHRLARLYILQGEKDKDNYSKAITLLRDGSSEAQKKVDKETEYYIRTYIGWARVGQQRYTDAAPRLTEAIKIYTELINPPSELPKALPHCLLAKVFEEQKDKRSSLEWNKCVDKGEEKKPDEDAWIGTARQRSQNKGSIQKIGGK